MVKPLTMPPRFRQQHVPDNMPALKAHRLRRFRQPFIHFAQTHLRDAGKNGVAASVSGTTAAQTP